MYIHTLGNSNKSRVTVDNADLVYGPGDWYVMANGAIGPKPGIKTYWMRFAKLMWGKDPDQLAANGIWRKAVEDAVKADARRYSLFYKDPNFQGWFANRPEEYELFRRDYPEFPAIDHSAAKAAGQQYYDPYSGGSTEAMVRQERLKEQGIETAFNTRATVRTGGTSSSLFSIGPAVAPASAPAPVPVVPTITQPPQSQQAQQAQQAQLQQSQQEYYSGDSTNYSQATGAFFEAGFPDTAQNSGSAQTSGKSGMGAIAAILGLLMLGS